MSYSTVEHDQEEDRLIICTNQSTGSRQRKGTNKMCSLFFSQPQSQQVIKKWTDVDHLHQSIGSSLFRAEVQLDVVDVIVLSPGLQAHSVDSFSYSRATK